MKLSKPAGLKNPWLRTRLKINIINTTRLTIVILLIINLINGVIDPTWPLIAGSAIIFLVSQYFVEKLQQIADYQMMEILRIEALDKPKGS